MLHLVFEYLLRIWKSLVNNRYANGWQIDQKTQSYDENFPDNIRLSQFELSDWLLEIFRPIRALRA